MDASAIASREAGLHKELSRAQLIMIGLGGAIGTGLFMGSGVAIGYAGPAVIVSYAIAAIAAVAIVFSLSEMAVMHPTAGSFGTYAEIYLNPWAGIIARYSYWMAQVIAVGAEAVAAGVYMTFYFPGTPVWLWSVGFALVLLYFNSRSVHNFGSIEYWFALIKVVAIVIFIILGAATIFGLWTTPVGFHNLTGLPGGFMPHGFGGVWMAVILGILSFNGIEVIAVTSGEAKDPVRTIPQALRSMALRLFLFYILALTIVVTFVPWTETGATVVTQSPFVRIFAHSGIRHAAGIMNFVVLSAALSSMNTNVYLCSRMLFSLSRGGFAPGFLGRLSKNGTPITAILLSGACILAAAALSKLTPRAYNYSVRRRAVRRDDRMDHHSLESFKLPAQAQIGRLAGSHAGISRCANCRAAAALRGLDYHGAGQGDLADLLESWHSMAVAAVGRLFSHEASASAHRCSRGVIHL